MTIAADVGIEKAVSIQGLDAGAIASVLLTTPSQPARLSDFFFFSRTDFGVEKAVSIQGLDPGAIATKLQELVKAGESLPRCVCARGSVCVCVGGGGQRVAGGG